MKFNRIFPIIIACGGLMAASTSCEDMLDTTSDGYVFDKDHRLDSANDSLYSAIGILTQMQQLGERYAVLGEIRGDLVSVPASAPVDYQDISAFNPLGSESPLLSRRDYYSVINNCNVALSRMDTSISEHGTQVMLPEYAAIVAMRSWTMLQVALTYGSVSYFTEPILDVESAEHSIPHMPLDQLVTKLISDLEPYASVETPDYGTISGLSSRNFFIRPAIMLADLYLYNGDYSQAAAMYYRVIDEAGYTVSVSNANQWTSSVRAEAQIAHNTTYTNEAVATIPYSSDARSYHPDMVNITFNTLPRMVPAEWWVNDMSAAQHFHIDRLGITNISGYLEGDLRGMVIDRDGNTTASAYGMTLEPGTSTERCLINKYLCNGTEFSSVTNPGNPMFPSAAGTTITRQIQLYRIPHLYLRFAEAANRAGKPSLAFAVLKYGLRAEVLEDPEKVDPSELEDKVAWTNFSDTRYNENYGTAMRGRGLGIAVEQTSFVIPAGLADRTARVEWVEERILEEMAAETSFEGNRFFDLLRISRHRPDHPSFIARQIGRRFDNPAAVEAKLADISALWVR